VHLRRVAVVVAGLLVGACSSGERSDFVVASTTSSTAVPAPTTTGATSTTAVPAGSVTLRVSGFTLPDVRSGGTGLRLLVRSTAERVSVRRRGGGGAVSACAIALAMPSPADGACVDLAAGGAVELPFAGGVELRATGAEAAVEEATVTYVAATRTTTVVTPARPAGACEARACEITFSLTPAAAGNFVLDGRAGGGRPRLVLTSVGTGGSNRTLATVEGGGSLSIRATIEAGSEARLLHQEQGRDAVAPVTAEISWP
jgi:hypothetical protein